MSNSQDPSKCRNANNKILEELEYIQKNINFSRSETLTKLQTNLNEINRFLAGNLVNVNDKLTALVNSPLINEVQKIKEMIDNSNDVEFLNNSINNNTNEAKDSIKSSISELVIELNDVLDKTKISINQNTNENASAVQSSINSLDGKLDGKFYGLDNKISETKSAIEGSINGLAGNVLSIGNSFNIKQDETNKKQDETNRLLDNLINNTNRQVDDLTVKLNNKEEEISNLRVTSSNEISSLRNDISNKDNFIQSLTSDVRQKDMQITEQNSQLQNLENQLTNKINEINNLSSDLNDMTNQKENLASNLTKTTTQLQNQAQDLQATNAKFSGFDEVVEPYVKILSLVEKCPSTNSLVAEFLPVNTKTIIKFIGFFGSDLSFANKIYNAMKSYKTTNKNPIENCEITLFDSLNEFYKDNNNVEFDVMSIPLENEKFNKLTLQDLEKPSNTSFRKYTEVYVPMIMKDEKNVTFRGVVKGSS